MADTGDPTTELNMDIPTLVNNLRSTWQAGRTRGLQWRTAQLRAMRRMLVENEAEICAAVAEDMGRPRLEAWALEIGVTKAEIDHALKHLATWMRDRKVDSPMVNFPSSSWVQVDPLGVVLVLGPWNYPMQLLMLPAAQAIAAGNCVLLKPSESSPATSRLVARLVPQYMDNSTIAVVEGAVAEATELLEQRFDHIFFTGGEVVGRIVMTAAAKHLTPVTLELGGKCPVYVAADANVKIAARRICWGKFVNAGQTCLAPDYVLVDRRVSQTLLRHMKAVTDEFFAGDPRASADFGRVVNDHHHARLEALLGDGEAFMGGQSDASDRYIAPTILRDVGLDSPVMREEIFGPILPVIDVDSTTEAISFMNARPHPLALYVFSESEQTSQQVLRATSSGGACINDVVSHAGVPDLPFGGVGPSGMGAYHGQFGFENFSHLRSVVRRSTAVDVKVRYAPYKGRLKWVKLAL